MTRQQTYRAAILLSLPGRVLPDSVAAWWDRLVMSFVKMLGY